MESVPIRTAAASVAKLTPVRKRNQTAPGSAPSTSKAKGTNEVYNDLLRLVAEGDISLLPGHTLNLKEWNLWLPRAVEQGFVDKETADYVLNGITHGFDLGLDEDKVSGRQYYRNYKSALEHRSTVSDALAKRVKSGKTVKLGAWRPGDPLPSGARGCVVPQGAVPKKLEPDSIRPTSDHTKTTFNGAVDLSQVAHTLNTYDEIAKELRPGYFMRVEDVDGAFPVLPLAPRVWKYCFVHWFDLDRPLDEQEYPNTLYVHVFADFGAAPSPGVWDKFFRCAKAMARAAGVLTLPMPHYVDDNSLIGPDADEVDRVAEALGEFLQTLGISFKALKSRQAASRQLVLGFYWDSVERTRTLEPFKLDIYLAHLREVRGRRHITLHDMQVLAGRMQRASLTMPPRAVVYLSNLLSLMKGLKLPWHRKRVTRELRRDLDMLISVLETNHGRGYFSYDHFERAAPLYTDAAKESRHTGGGYFSECGAYDFWKYGSRVARQHIDALEGLAILRAAQALGPSWRGKVVPIHCDNSAFERSLAKGRSRAPRLNVILRQLFLLSVRYDCVFEPHWISTHDNIAADALSRGDLPRFSEFVAEQYGPLALRRVPALVTAP